MSRTLSAFLVCLLLAACFACNAAAQTSGNNNNNNNDDEDIELSLDQAIDIVECSLNHTLSSSQALDLDEATKILGKWLNESANTHSKRQNGSPYWACFYEHTWYRGRVHCDYPLDISGNTVYHPDLPRESGLTWLNDLISSIRISGGVGVTAFEHPNYRGVYESFMNACGYQEWGNIGLNGGRLHDRISSYYVSRYICGGEGK